jgi:hypothetical protein
MSEAGNFISFGEAKKRAAENCGSLQAVKKSRLAATFLTACERVINRALSLMFL